MPRFEEEALIRDERLRSIPLVKSKRETALRTAGAVDAATHGVKTTSSRHPSTPLFRVFRVFRGQIREFNETPMAGQNPS